MEFKIRRLCDIIALYIQSLVPINLLRILATFMIYSFSSSKNLYKEGIACYVLIKILI